MSVRARGRPAVSEKSSSLCVEQEENARNLGSVGLMDEGMEGAGDEGEDCGMRSAGLMDGKGEAAEAA